MSETSETHTAAAPPVQRRRRRRARPEPEIPLGSLTQQSTIAAPTCARCNSSKVTRLAMRLLDGTDVDFTSCQACEHRQWEHNGEVLPRETVLQKTRSA